MRNQKRQTTKKPPRIPILPKEILEIVERGQILLSGVVGIEEYCLSCIRIKTAKGVIAISGECLSLCWAGEKRLLLKGRILNIAFL